MGCGSPKDEGLTLHDQISVTGKLPESEALIRRSMEIRRRTGDTGYAYAESMITLGGVLAKENRLAEAEALDRQGLASLKNFVEADDHRIVEATQQLANLLRAEGR
jgi:Tetratricopeptide repeat